MAMVYHTDWGPVRISEAEATQLKRWHDCLRVPWVVGGARLDKVKRNYRAKMADIERVARWKLENGHE